MTDDVQKGWVYITDDNTVVYRTFSFGNCLRSLVAARMGETPFPNHFMRPFLDASGGLEDEILERVIGQISGHIIWKQKEFDLSIDVPDSDAPVVIRCHIDGLHQESDTIVEVKALGQNNWDKFMSGESDIDKLDALGKLGRKYRMQGAIQGFASGRHVRFAIGKKVVVEGKDPYVTDVYVTKPIDPEELWARRLIEARVIRVEHFAEIDELPDCDDGCREGDPYSEAHIFRSIIQGDDDLLAKLVRHEELREILGSDKKGERSGLLGEFEDIKDAIKELGNDQTTEKVTAGPFTVTIVAQKGRASVDGKWLKKTHPDIYDQALKIGKPFRTLIVKGSAKGQRDEGNDVDPRDSGHST